MTKKKSKLYYASGVKFLFCFPSASFSGGFPFLALSKSVFSSFKTPCNPKRKISSGALITFCAHNALKDFNKVADVVIPSLPEGHEAFPLTCPFVIRETLRQHADDYK